MSRYYNTFQPSSLSGTFARARLNAVPTQAELEAWARAGSESSSSSGAVPEPPPPSWDALTLDEQYAAQKKQRDQYRAVYQACVAQTPPTQSAAPDKGATRCLNECRNWQIAKKRTATLRKQIQASVASAGSAAPIAQQLSLVSQQPAVLQQIAGQVALEAQASGAPAPPPFPVSQPVTPTQALVILEQSATAQKMHAKAVARKEWEEARRRAKRRAKHKHEARRAKGQKSDLASAEAQELAAVAPVSSYEEEEGPNWKLWAGVGGVVLLVGGAAYWFGRR